MSKSKKQEKTTPEPDRKNGDYNPREEHEKNVKEDKEVVKRQ